MKKIAMFLLSISILLSLVACNKNIDDQDDPISDSNLNYKKISEYMKEESILTFSPYYDLLEFQINQYKEEVIDNKIHATFLYKILMKNLETDPDKVGYIKEAKERGDKNYQQLYDEYLKVQEMNFDLKVIIDENDSFILFSNNAPKGIEWVEIRMSDFISIGKGAEDEFTGVISEINNETAIVLVDEGETIRNSGDLVDVNLSINKDVTFNVGDRVRVGYTGPIQEKYPLGIETVFILLTPEYPHFFKWWDEWGILLA